MPIAVVTGDFSEQKNGLPPNTWAGGRDAVLEAVSKPGTQPTHAAACVFRSVAVGSGLNAPWPTRERLCVRLFQNGFLISGP
jgi:hypothetical protein